MDAAAGMARDGDALFWCVMVVEVKEGKSTRCHVASLWPSDRILPTAVELQLSSDTNPVMVCIVELGHRATPLSPSFGELGARR